MLTPLCCRLLMPSTEWKCAAICSKRCGAVFSICIPQSRAQKMTAVKCVLYPESFQNCRQEYRGVQKGSQTTAPTRGAGLNPVCSAWRGRSCDLVGVIMRQRKGKGTMDGGTRSSTARPPSSATTVRLRQYDATVKMQHQAHARRQNARLVLTLVAKCYARFPSAPARAI